jgi:hypothetical protein
MKLELTNFEKRAGVFLAMIATITALWYYQHDLYDIIFINLGVFFTASKLGTWARERWPKETNELKLPTS